MTDTKTLKEFGEFMNNLFDKAEDELSGIEIAFRNGEVTHYHRDEYDDYKYDGKYFIVIKDCRYIGFYNLDAVSYIEVIGAEKDKEESK